MYETIELEIPFYDLDPMQVVWHGNYIKYFERARCALLAKIGMTYIDMNDAGYAFPVVKLSVKYIRPCTFGQRIIVKATLIPSDSFLIFDYEITDATSGTKICHAQTKQMAFDIANECSLCIIPEPFLSKIQGAK